MIIIIKIIRFIIRNIRLLLSFIFENRGAQKELIQSKRINIFIFSGFLFLIALAWLDEYYIFSSFLLGEQHVSYVWENALFETLLILIVAVFTYLSVDFSFQKCHIIESRLRRTADDLKKFQLAVDEVSDHIVITDPEGIILYANKAVEKITGFKVKEIIGKKAGSKELWGGLMDRDVYRELWRMIRDEKKPFAGEIVNKRKDGEKYDAEIHVSPILDENGQIVFYVGIEIDISKTKELERAKTEFVSLASHQLKSPLTSISLSVDLLLRGIAGTLNDEQKKYLKEIYADVHHTADLVGALLNLSRVEMGTFRVEPEIVNVPEMIEAVMDEILPQARAGRVEVDAEYGKDLKNVLLDKNILKVALQNLVSNAVKYARKNGYVKIVAKADRGELIISVADNGIGIPVRDQEKIFTKFFRARNAVDKKTGGTGLGLSLSKALVEASGGKMWFESLENQGTVFYLSLPFEKNGDDYEKDVFSDSRINLYNK
jgi:PAS domain S-box-containing protein